MRSKLKYRLRAWGFPLLTKELLEQSARRRTYIVRTGYALLLYAIAFLLFYERLNTAGTSPTQVLGQGKMMFEIVVALQFVGIYLFMPALTCSVITHEKERDSLALLMLTRLSPRMILLEKLLSRVVLMLSFELMLLPLLGLAYTFGGVAWEEFLKAAWFLALATLQMGCLALFCSSFFRTTVQSFIASYIIGAGWLFGWPLLWEFNRHSTAALAIFFHSLGVTIPDHEISFVFFAPAMYFGSGALAEASILSIPIICSTFFLLVGARMFFVRRAFVQPRHLMLKVFRAIDRLFFRLNNNRFTRGIVLASSSDSTPGDDPVRWREVTKSGLGSMSHLVRILLILELPVVGFCLMVSVAESREGFEVMVFMQFLLWFILILIVSVRAAGIIAGERSRQTLDAADHVRNRASKVRQPATRRVCSQYSVVVRDRLRSELAGCRDALQRQPCQVSDVDGSVFAGSRAVRRRLPAVRDGALLLYRAAGAHRGACRADFVGKPCRLVRVAARLHRHAGGDHHRARG